jgi:hypothetical protein
VKKKRFSVEQITAVLQQAEGGHLGGVSPEQFEAAHKPHRKGVH